MQESLRPKEYKFTILGPPMVGKSNITSRFFKDSFTDDYDPTLEGRFTRSTYLDNEEFILEAFPGPDDLGQQVFVTLHNLWTHGKDGLIFVFAIDREHTFHEAVARLTEAKQQCNNNVPCILVGNKVDLEKLRQVQTKVAEQTVRRLDIKYFEVSAKENINIELIFQELIRQNELRKVYKPKEPGARRKGVVDTIAEACQNNCLLF